MERARQVHFVQLAIVVLFFLSAYVGIDTPRTFLFDEKYYIGAAINFADMSQYVNREHPNLAKEILAVGWLIKANNLAWLRFIALLFATLGFYWSARAMWLRTRSAFASITFSFLLLTGILLLSLSRMAVLEPFVFGFAALSCFFFVRGNHSASAIATGLALACKWTVAPIALFLTLARFKVDWRKSVLFALVAGCAYFVTFIPGAFVQEKPLNLVDLPFLHLAMWERISLFVREHPYQSRWWQWLYGGGSFYLGPQAVPVMLNMALAAPSIVALLRFRDKAIGIMGVSALLLVACSGKPVTLIHQFLLVHAFALAALSIELERIPRTIAYPYLGLCGVIALFSVLVWRPNYPSITTTISPTEESLDAMDEAVECMEFPRQCYLGKQPI